MTDGSSIRLFVLEYKLDNISWSKRSGSCSLSTLAAENASATAMFARVSGDEMFSTFGCRLHRSWSGQDACQREVICNYCIENRLRRCYNTQ